MQGSGNARVEDYDESRDDRRASARGVPELWLVDTAADVALVFRRCSSAAPAFDVSEELGAGATLSSPLLPGFALPVTDVFAG